MHPCNVTSHVAAEEIHGGTHIASKVSEHFHKNTQVPGIAEPYPSLGVMRRVRDGGLPVFPDSLFTSGLLYSSLILCRYFECCYDLLHE